MIVFENATVFLKNERQSLMSRLFLGVANSLYKLRKLMFVLHHASSTSSCSSVEFENITLTK